MVLFSGVHHYHYLGFPVVMVWAVAENIPYKRHAMSCNNQQCNDFIHGPIYILSFFIITELTITAFVLNGS